MFDAGHARRSAVQECPALAGSRRLARYLEEEGVGGGPCGGMIEALPALCVSNQVRENVRLWQHIDRTPSQKHEGGVSGPASG